MPRDPRSHTPPRILVVEDEALIALETMGHLQDWGYQLAGTAGTSREALAIAKREDVYLALVDVNLRHGDSGIDLARVLKERFGIGIVFVTGFSDEGSKREMAAVDPIACLFKPYEPQSLERVLAGRDF